MSKPPDTFSYKGYIGSAEISHDDECLTGKILHIEDLVMYEGKTYAALRRAFNAAVDSYLATCQKLGKEPQKAYSGNLNIRIEPSEHARAARLAQQTGITLNEYIKQAIETRNADARIQKLSLTAEQLGTIVHTTLVGHSTAVSTAVLGQHLQTSAASTASLH